MSKPPASPAPVNGEALAAKFSKRDRDAAPAGAAGAADTAAMVSRSYRLPEHIVKQVRAAAAYVPGRNQNAIVVAALEEYLAILRRHDGVGDTYPVSGDRTTGLPRTTG